MLRGATHYSALCAIFGKKACPAGSRDNYYWVVGETSLNRLSLNRYCRVFVSALPRYDKIGAFRVYTGVDESAETGYQLMFSARVAELVDALDLGSSAPSAWGFNSPLSHHERASLPTITAGGQ